MISIETCVRSEENDIVLYDSESNELLLNGVKKVGIMETENLMEKEEFIRNSQNEFRNRWHEKRMHGQFACEVFEEVDEDVSWKWFVQCDLKVQTEATICAPHDQALRTNYTKNKIDNPLRRMCGEKVEVLQHICECKKLA